MNLAARRLAVSCLGLALLMALSLIAPAIAWSAPLDAETKTNVANALWMLNFDPAQIPPAVLARLASPVNSNVAYGNRMNADLQALIDDPMTFTPDYTAYYANLARFTSSVTPHQAQARSSYLGLDASRGYLNLPFLAVPNTLVFPQANEVDLNAQFGWYYVVGTATGSNGKHYGILLMLLSTGLVPPPVAVALGLTPSENMSTQLQLAVNEEGGKHHQARPTIVAGTTGLLRFKRGLFNSVMGKNRMESLRNDGSFFPMRMQALGWDHSTAPPTEIKIDITFASGGDYLREGNNGCEPCCGRVGTLYYSIPRMLLDPTKSSLVLNGQRIQLESGTFWLDHQWGTTGNPKSEVLRAFGNLQEPGVVGWDFFPVNFTGNRELAVIALHDKALKNYYGQTGPNPPGPLPMTVTVHGKYVDEYDHFTNVKGTLSVTKWVRSTSTSDPAQYPVSKVWYPDQWEFSFGSTLPPDIRKFTMKPLTHGDSTLYFAAGAQYQEAPVNITNSHGDPIGTGFAEATGYSQVPVVISNELRIAGLPNTAADFTPPPPSPALINQSKMFLQQPENQLILLVESLLCSFNTDGTPADDELHFDGRWP